MGTIAQRNKAHLLINWWVNTMRFWELNCCLWYPNESVEKRMLQGYSERQAGAKHPKVMFDIRLRKIDRIMRNLPEGLQDIAYFKYDYGSALEGQRIKAYQEKTGRSYSSYYRDLDKLWDYVAEGI